MGKPTGFIDYLREIPADRTPLERAGDWGEFHYHMPEDKLRTQGLIKVVAERNVVDEALDQVAKAALKNSLDGKG